MGIKTQTNWVGPAALFKAHETWFLISLVILPYASYLGLVGLGLMLLGWLVAYPQEIWHRLCHQGWLWLTLGMGLSIVFAENPVQAALQSTNFWPFFVFFAGLSIYITRLPQPFQSLEQWAFWLLMASIPINLRALVEYLFATAPLLKPTLDINGAGQVMSWASRVDSVFGNPNVLAAYLVIVFGLGLGLCLQTLHLTTAQKTQSPASPRSITGVARSRLSSLLPQRIRWTYGATALIPIGILCSGSRNGVLALILQLLIATALMRRHRQLLWVGLGGATAIFIGMLHWGIGGRSIPEAFSSSQIRLDIWKMALPIIQQHPWLGIGFGGFQANYVPNSIPYHPFLAHLHNLWLHLAAEAGLPVMLIFTGIVGWICYRAVRHYSLSTWCRGDRPLLIGYGLGFLACVLFAMFDITLFDVRVNLLGWVMLAVLQALSDLAEAHDDAVPSPSDHDYAA